MKHKHHVVPKHMGGGDEPENIVELSIEEHAEEHRKLYELHGHWQDSVAWKGLLGLLTSNECSFIAITEGARKGALTVNARRAIPGKDPKLPYHKWLSGYSQDVDGRKVRIKRFWFNDSVLEGQFSLEDFPAGWKRGRLKSSTAKSFKNVSL